MLLSMHAALQGESRTRRRGGHGAAPQSPRSRPLLTLHGCSAGQPPSPTHPAAAPTPAPTSAHTLSAAAATAAAAGRSTTGSGAVQATEGQAGPQLVPQTVHGVGGGSGGSGGAGHRRVRAQLILQERLR